MPIYLDTRGNTNLGIGICDRCRRKFPINELQPDRNTPGLLVCEADNDVFDPWRLPPRQSEDITLPHYRPDVSLAVVEDSGSAVPPSGEGSFDSDSYDEDSYSSDSYYFG